MDPTDPLAGELNGFIFKRTSPDQFDEIQELVFNNFYPDEPITNRLGFTDGYDRDCQAMWQELLGGPLSFCVYEKETNKLVAVRITTTEKVDDEHPVLQSEEGRKLAKVFGTLAEDGDLFRKYDLDEYVYLVLTTVHKGFRGRGIATEIYRRTIALCPLHGFILIACNFSSPFSLKAAMNVGFQKAAVCNYYEMKDEKGNKFIEGSKPGDQVVLAVYKL